MTPITPLERRLSVVVTVAAILIFLGLLLAVPAFYQTFDEAKYLGIGYNFVTGNGPRTLFGPLFLPHSPLWPAIVVAPSVWFGVDPYSWGHLLNGVAAAGLLALVAAFGWQIRPAIGGLAAAGYLAVPYLHDLTRTSRLDVPAAALALLYVWIGLLAVRRGSFAWGLAAGAAFAVAFLVKEIALPLVPVPFLMGLVLRRPWPGILRTAAGTVLAAAIGTSWWFLLYADSTHEVYRLGTPSWTLAPLAVAGLVLVGLGLLAPRLATRLRLPTELPPRAGPVLGWGLAIAWFAALAIFFDRNAELKGNGLFQPRQWALYLQQWIPELRNLVVLGIVGVVLALVAWRRTSIGREGYALIAMSLLCSAPLVLLVIAVGEPPRNYLAQIGLLIALAAAGWFAAAEWVARRLLPRLRWPDPVAAGLPRPWLVAGFALVLIGGSGFLATHALAFRESASGQARAAAVRTVTDWIKANVPPGTPVAFGSFLGYEMSVELRGEYPMVSTGQSLMVANPAAPYGIAPYGNSTLTDLLAVDIAPRRALEFYAYRASTFTRIHRERGTRIYVHNTGTTTSVPSLLPALTPDHGFTLLARWTWPVRSAAGIESTIESDVYAVEPSRITFTDSPIFMTPAALDRLVSALERTPSDGTRAAAGNLLARVRVAGDPTGAGPIMARLAALARG